jgi:hypothetical protein
LFAVVEETVYLVDRGWEMGRIRPGVSVFDSGAGGGGQRSRGGAAVAEPLRIPLPQQPVVVGHVEVRRTEGDHALVTAVEVLSLTNKADRRGRNAYQRKREAYYDAGVHVVEIDLLRGGEELVDVPWEEVPAEARTAYKACVRRAPAGEADQEVEYYSLDLRKRLPAISIPLRPGDKDVILDLQEPVDLAYERGSYGAWLDYSKPPQPPLNEADAAWALELIQKRGG